MNMLWVLVLCVVRVESGFISVVDDRIVDAKEKNETSRRWEGYEQNFGLERAGGHEEILLPLLMAAGTKLIGLLPLMLTTLALIAGFGLASSKAALLLGGGLVLYYYLKENKTFLPIASKHVTPLTDWSPFHSQHLLHHDHPDFTRDRVFNGKRIFRDN